MLLNKHSLSLFALFIFLIPTTSCFAQSAYSIIQDVELIGNKRTNNEVVLRELDLVPGDTLFSASITDRFNENEKRILSTGLFTDVSINLKNWDESSQQSTIEIILQENWYIYPNIIFELADRNFNVWWNEQGRSLDRVNFGFRLNHINVTGRRDRLKLVTQFGYTKKFEIEYSYPYLNKAQTLGIASNITYSENKEIGFVTIGNKTQFHQEEDERILLKRFRVSSWLNYRPKLFGHHILKFEFHRNSIDDFVATDLNPDYFLDEETVLHFFKVEYDYSYDRREFTFYPEAGYQVGFNIKKEGLGIFNEYNNLLFEIRGEYYWNYKSKLIFANIAKAKTNIIRDKIAFANNTGLGYNGNVVSGYELFVVDGTDFILTKSSLRWKIIDKVFNLNEYMPLRQFKLMNMKIYFSLNTDTGYVNEPTYTDTNTLNNKWIIGYGPGLDILLFNNYLFSFEYSFNQLGQSGLFISNRVSF